MVEQQSPEMGLLLQNVSGTDTAKIAAFLRLGTNRLKHTWRIVSDRQPRVLLSGSDFFDTLPSELEGPITALRLVDEQASDAAASPGVLARPLQYDDFISALAQAEPGVEAARGQGPAGPPPSARSTQPATTPAGAARAAAPSPARSPAPGRAPSSDAPFVLASFERFRLRRWPEAALLTGHRYHVRLASFLSTRHLSIDELVGFSNVNAADCTRFLQVLGDAGLLDALAAAPAAPPAAGHTSEPARPAPTGRAAASGDSLFSRLRRRLGME